LTAQAEPLPARDFQDILKGWGVKNPDGLMAWVEANPDMLTQYNGHWAFIEGLTKNSPQLATNWLTQHQDLSPRQFGEAVSATYLSTLYRDGLPGMTQWLAGLPDTQAFQAASKRAWHEHLGRLTLIGSEDTAALWKAVGDKPWVGIQELSSLLSHNYEGVSSNPAKMEAIAGPDLTRQFERWATQDPERVSRWLATETPTMNAQVPKTFRNSAIQGLVNSLRTSDPEAAAVWERQLVK
jgi:hypothetical protein